MLRHIPSWVSGLQASGFGFIYSALRGMLLLPGLGVMSVVLVWCVNVLDRMEIGFTLHSRTISICWVSMPSTAPVVHSLATLTPPASLNKAFFWLSALAPVIHPDMDERAGRRS
ncbi:hypothetical protein P153DRAFT_121595 [Dothidotthia symphoricarpi CBS 119687]|uniref:Uncharacterized protein n=1 Tax=Dothidotthia symphoricarpi CBS 119687 TaxID=1392245 RepID=A0A6A6A0U6_9PLEO|nr:uncharacterized protein P153DRAFT_121595 [Dothidotthia symphoricarpi CBS 119687]KAF2125156.1 hypothetical protein P153DRAFT_121595 [Dothidotthia symphoricarpi CBS 119687]